MWAAVRYRRAQALVIAGLSALITACLAFAPLYERALDQALVRVALDRAPDLSSGVSLTSASSRQPERLASPAELLASLPAALRDASRSPLSSTTVHVAVGDGDAAPVGILTTRTAMCEHVRITAGRCPAARGEVAVTVADASLRGWRVGQRLSVTEVVPGTPSQDTPRKTLTVTGLYHQQPGEYWFGQVLDGRSGTSDPWTGQEFLDAWLTAPATMEGDLAHAGATGPDGAHRPSNGTTDPAVGWMAPAHVVDLPLREDVVGVDELPRLTRAVAALQSASLTSTKAVTVHSELPSIADEVARGREQSGVIVPLLMAQLGLLALVVLWLVLVAAIEQRRPEVALARLRGRGADGARRLLATELGATVLAGVPVGFAAAVALSVTARHTWLAPGVPFEMPLRAPLAAAAAGVVSMAAVVLAARSTTREPIAALLRRIPARRGGWALGVADAVAVAVAVAGVVALVSGNLSGPLALATPTLLALAVGLLLAHLLIPVSALAGRRLLARGRMVAGLTSLQIARRPAVRRVVTVITVATALVVFASDAMVVGQRNRDHRAEAEVGAPVVLTVLGNDVEVVRRALGTVDPGGREATPVFSVGTVGAGGTTTQAVLPEQFRRIAQFPGHQSEQFDWAALAAPATQPLAVRGRRLALVVTGLDVHADPPVEPPAGTALADRLPRLGLQLVHSDGSRTDEALGLIPLGPSRPTPHRTEVSCSDECRLVAITVDAPASRYTSTTGRFSIGGLTVDGRSVALGGPGSWAPAAAGRGHDAISAAGDASTLTIEYADGGGPQLTLRQASSPDRVPALFTGDLPPAADGDLFQSPGMDGRSRDMHVVGRLPFAPGGATNTAIVNLETLQRDGTTYDALATMQVWLARNDPALVSRVTAALRKAGAPVVATTSTSAAAAVYDASASAWGLQLALVVGLAALVMAALVVIVVVSTSWRHRARDYAALRMVGLRGRDLAGVAVGEQLVVVVVAVVVGSGCGLLGAALALPIVPMFTTPPQMPVIDLGPSWPAVLAAAAVALVSLVAVGVRVGRGLARRSGLERVREVL